MNIRIKFAGALLAVVPAGWAQTWELGALGGYGFSNNISVRSSDGSVSAGFKNGPVFGATGGENSYRFLSGEASYLYRQSGPKLSGNGAEANFGGHTHFLDFRMLLHRSNNEAQVSPFVAIGGGVAVYTGTGEESSTQPLNEFAALTKTHQTKPMLSAAAGLKIRLTDRIGIRAELRDYVTPFPDQVIAPVPGASASGWLHNITPLIGIVGIF